MINNIEEYPYFITGVNQYDINTHATIWATCKEKARKIFKELHPSFPFAKLRM